MSFIFPTGFELRAEGSRRGRWAGVEGVLNRRFWPLCLAPCVLRAIFLSIKRVDVQRGSTAPADRHRSIRYACGCGSRCPVGSLELAVISNNKCQQAAAALKIAPQMETVQFLGVYSAVLNEINPFWSE